MTEAEAGKRVRVRPYRAGDDDGIADLRKKAYPRWPEAHDGAWHAGIHRWLERSPLAAESHRWVADAGGSIVGHLAAVPLPYLIAGSRLVAHTPADFMSMPGHGFHALSLMRLYFRTCPRYVACDSVPEATAIEKSFGAREVGDLRSVIKVLDPSRAPGKGDGAVGVALGAAGGISRSVDRALLRSRAGLPTTQVMPDFDERFDSLLERVASAVPCTVAKDAAFLRWRYGPGSPQSPATVIAVVAKHEVLGYAVLRVTSDGDGYLLDLTASPDRGDVACALARAVVIQSWKQGVAFLRYRYLESATAPSPTMLRRLGFLDRHGSRYTLPGLRTRRRHTLLTRFPDARLQAITMDTSGWSYSIGDGEVSYWVG